MNRPATPPIAYRPDIDGLRAIAVLSVVAFHAFPHRLPSGFIGVDIFFVISGYLISSLIFAGLARGTFTYADFYARRIRRIFPSLLTVVFAVCVAGAVLLLGDEFKRLGKHVAAAAGFVSNWVLSRENGYFETASEKKPLLHLWSLAIEEQFYLVWPLLLAFVARRRRSFLLPLVLVTVASFAFGLYAMTRNQLIAFYWPLGRFWELTSGALLAHLTRTQSPLVAGSSSMRSWLGLSLLGAGLLTIAEPARFPGAWPLLPVVGTALLISAGPDTWFNRHVLAHRALVLVGLVSYPLYLWHWPILSLLRTVSLEAPTAQARLLAVGLSLPLTWLTYRFVEQPLRHGPPTRRRTLALCAALVAMALTGWCIQLADGFPERPVNRAAQAQEQAIAAVKASYPLIPCTFASEDVNAGCLQYNAEAPGPPIVLWGDSHAGAWTPVLARIAQTLHKRLLIFANDGCPSVLQARRSDRPDNLPTCGRIGQGEAILEAFAPLQPSSVILASRWSWYIEPWVRDGELWDTPHYLTSTLTGPASLETSRQTLERQLPATVQALLALPTHVVIFQTPPQLKRYLTPRHYTHAALVEPTASDFAAQQARTRRIIDRVASEPGVAILDPSKLLCGETCRAIEAGTVLYDDDNHISANGSLRFTDAIRAVVR